MDYSIYLILIIIVARILLSRNLAQSKRVEPVYIDETFASICFEHWGMGRANADDANTAVMIMIALKGEKHAAENLKNIPLKASLYLYGLSIDGSRVWRHSPYCLPGTVGMFPT